MLWISRVICSNYIQQTLGVGLTIHRNILLQNGVDYNGKSFMPIYRLLGFLVSTAIAITVTVLLDVTTFSLVKPLKIKTTGLSEMLVTIYQTTRRQIPKEGNLHLCKEARREMMDPSEVDVTNLSDILTGS
jgi:hypothetical protein